MKTMIVAAGVVLVVLLSAGISLGSDERQFTGSLVAESATDLGDEVRITVTLTLFNFGSADATNARIVVADTGVLALAEQVDIPARGGSAATVVHGIVSVPSATYELWLRGMPIAVLIERDVNGEVIRQLVELVP